MTGSITYGDNGKRALRLFAMPIGERGLLSGAILFILGLQFTQIFRRGINWDEFAHYNQLWELHRGTLNEAINTIYVPILVWVIKLPGDAIDHIIMIRMMMFAFELGILASIIAIASRFTNVTIGLLCALAYITFPFVFGHGYSFRFDPPVTALMIGVAWVILARPLDWKTILAVGAMIGLSLTITIKIVLLLPAFAGLLWLTWSDRGYSRDYAARIALVGFWTLIVAGGIFAALSASLPTGTADESKRLAGGVGAIMFALEPKPYWFVALVAAVRDPLVTALIAIFPFALCRSNFSTSRKIALAAFFSTLTTLIYYHNTAPYYYVFMLPWVLIACSVSFEAVLKRFSPILVGVALLFSGLLSYINERETPIDKQRAILAAARESFPTGTAYFDFMGMLANLPKANEFMTPLNIKRHHAAGRSVYTEAMADRPVPLLVVNDQHIAQLLTDRDTVPVLHNGLEVFTPEDAEALRDTYIPFWGPFFLAGEVIPAGDQPYTTDIRVPGPYTLRGEAIMIKGKRFTDGDVVQLSRGLLTLEGKRQSQSILVWGNGIDPPAEPAPEQPYAPNW